MSRWEEKVRVTVGSVSLELPAEAVKGQDAAIDSAAGVFEGAGLRIIVDQGPFANRLDSFAGLPEYRQESREVSGTTGHAVSFRSPDRGTSTTAIHLPAPKFATVVVEAEPQVPPQVPPQIIDSLRWVERSPEERKKP